MPNGLAGAFHALGWIVQGGPFVKLKINPVLMRSDRTEFLLVAVADDFPARMQGLCAVWYALFDESA